MDTGHSKSTIGHWPMCYQPLYGEPVFWGIIFQWFGGQIKTAPVMFNVTPCYLWLAVCTFETATYVTFSIRRHKWSEPQRCLCIALYKLTFIHLYDLHLWPCDLCVSCDPQICVPSGWGWKFCGEEDRWPGVLWTRGNWGDELYHQMIDYMLGR